MRGYKQAKHIKHVGYFLVTCRLLQFTSLQPIYSICLYIQWYYAVYIYILVQDTYNYIHDLYICIHDLYI